MGHSNLSSLVSLCSTICSALIVVSVLGIASTTYAIGGKEADRLALLEFKKGITHDPFMVFSSWNNSIDFCEWRGVTCGHRHRRVTKLHLAAKELVGSISPFIGNLSFLRILKLQNNSLIHEIPPEIGRLRRLRSLALHNNTISGRIPTNISGCMHMENLSLANNNLVGEIPVELSSLSKLKIFSVGSNRLKGIIPPFLGNLSSLEVLSAPLNNLSGSIPHSLSNLMNLKYIALGANLLSGTIPSQVFNLSSVTNFDVGVNQIHGSLPLDLGITFPNLENFALSMNKFTGSIPPSISNASNLRFITIAGNYFTGNVPSWEKLQKLQWLSTTDNPLGRGEADDLSFLFSLTNATFLELLAINNNSLGGVLPKYISNFSSTLKVFLIDANNIEGIIPSGISNLFNLERLYLRDNQLSGTIPHDLGKLQQLQEMLLSGNNLSGNIPDSFGNLSQLIRLDLKSNNLQGSIPSSLGNCQSLLSLDLYNNSLSGAIPPQVIGLSSLSVYLDLSQNHFTGSLPIEVGNLKNLGALYVSENMLSGEIPSSLGSCIKLEYLAMDENFFLGTIPSSLGSLRGLQQLDLSRNNLSGKIPDFFMDLKVLELLNLSYNNLEGLVPIDGVFKNSTATSVVGNNHLCGGIPEMELPKCNFGKPKKKKLTIILIVFGILGTTSVISFLFICWLRKKRTESISNSPDLSYQSLLKATGGFSPDNLLGVGSFGSVYKGILDEGRKTIAVKVLNLLQRGAAKSFLSECEALRNIRHRNLLKVLTVCSSVDFNGNDFKALVYEFMINGSLEDWLHPVAKEDEEQHEPRNLNLYQRLNIAIDVASALEYLHYHCQIPIVHCDLKPSNVLLDDEMVGHVGDFGLAKFSPEVNHINSSNEQSSSIGIRGTIGYTAPEYGMGNKVSVYGDVYSYGILLLEMFTKKGPTDDMFRGAVDLHSFVKEALPHRVIEITDPILFQERGGERNFRRNKIPEYLISILGIGVACSTNQPGERMNIKEVVARLHMIKKKLVADDDVFV
ncbi:hypothetical protein I3843_06G043000 [Carya illinoinensis]|nr:hypothetical protein I3760_06G046300 [Carya illinoinensis]KAG7974317.1 hypothetical protein I3843_06G043000 [Carya illinoinensis]